MNVTVCIPWIDNGCPWRAKAREHLAAYWAFLGVPVVYGIDTTRPVNRARARNNAARLVASDVLFFADADMWVPQEQFEAACEAALETDRFVHAYTQHVKLSKSTTQKILDGQRPALLGQTVLHMSHGAVAVSRRLHDMVGGHDERFEGWGGEDRSFMFACQTLTGVGPRIPGKSFHLWHPRSPELTTKSQMRRDNVELGQRYKRAAGIVSRSGILKATKGAKVDPAAMLAILSEDGGPLSGAGVASSHA